MSRPSESSATSSPDPEPVEPAPAADELDRYARPVGPIDLQLLAALPSLPLRARYLVESLFTGRHHSLIKGTAPEFAEYRSYHPGDELRRIDWRLYGRSDRLNVKQFEDERQLRICLALDLSASMRYASRSGLLSKFDYARTVLAAVAVLARRRQDAVALALVGDDDAPGSAGLADYLRPGSSHAHHQAVLGRLQTPPTARQASLPTALRRIATLLPGGGLLVVASDWYADLDPLDESLRLLRARRLDLIGLHVLDPQEIEFRTGRAGRFVDLEDGGRLPLNPAACRDGYLRRFEAYRRELAGRFREQRAELVLLRTDSDPAAALCTYLSRRAQRT